MGKIVFMFPGQGTQIVGMLKDICENYPAAMEVIQQADTLLEQPISPFIFEGPQSVLDLTVNTQPALLTIEVAAFRAIQSEGIRPDMLVGFSVGEWSAAVATNVLCFEEALRLVRLRAEAMQQAVPVGEGRMLVIAGKDETSVNQICEGLTEYVAPSNFNYPGQITVSGTSKAIEALEQMGEAGELVVTPLPVSIPSHCEMMRPAAEKIRDALHDIVFQDPVWPIIMNVDGKLATKGSVIKENLIQQLTKPVRFQQSAEYMLRDGVDTFVELGPGKTLAGFVRKTARNIGVNVFSNRTDNMKNLQEVLNTLSTRRR